jgi:hypothetical protein
VYAYEAEPIGCADSPAVSDITVYALGSHILCHDIFYKLIAMHIDPELTDARSLIA